MHSQVTLDDKYDLAQGRIFLTGVQALVRLPLEQRRRDEAAGLDTGGYITGYRGSPLATYDLQLARASKWLEAARIRFQPGLNEDLALTSVWGSQQAEARGDGLHDGVFAIWYGKGAGVDRSGDAFRHGNNAGSSKHGGVLVLLGDDHRAESSSAVHASEFAMMDFNIPVLNPADVAEILDYGLIGIAMSRFTGSWVSLKCNHEVVESGGSIEFGECPPPVMPEGYEMPEGGLNLRIPDTPMAQEARVIEQRLPAVKAFARANRIDRAVWRPEGARLGIVTTGKTWLEVLQALEDLGIDAARAEELGIALYKVGMPWPLEPEGIRAFCAGLETVLCVEEKRALIEPQIKDILFAERARPTVLGKLDETGRPLFPATGALSSNRIGIAITRQLGPAAAGLADRVAELEAREAPAQSNVVPFARKPYFCSGCPHNRSTVVPEGSRGGAGTGCNYMVMWMERGSDGYTQMGADGANWIGEAPFSRRTHIFQNMGDGTYNHSGLLAIRAAVAVGVNITYKILYNDAVAMTGGQPHEGTLTVAGIARQVLAEGVARVVLVSDDPWRNGGGLPPGVDARHRDDLDAVQRELREMNGVTVLIYDQMCATEKRRRRKRGTLADPDRRAFINHLVCEGCGDCGVKSNCVSVLPRETEFGRKRRVDQHSCNKDFSCIEGFCPSFVTVEGGRLRKPAARLMEAAAALPEPPLPPLDRPYNIVLAGVGGAGIVTTSSVLGMAAHLDGRGCATLDMMGLAQKGGAVTSHVRIARDPAASRAARIPEGAADLVLGADIMSVAGAEPVSTVRRDRTRLIVNTHEVTPGEFTRAPDLAFPSAALRLRIDAAAGRTSVQYLDATRMAEVATGDPITTNMLLVGYAWQQGLVPLSRAAIRRAVELNGATVEANLAAFEAGRRAFAEENADAAQPASVADSLDQLIERRSSTLEAYQDAAYARRYRDFVERIRAAEAVSVPGSDALTRAVAVNLAKLMAYKDEYEVARLHAGEEFRRDLESQFEGEFRLRYHLAPPLLARADPVTGEPRKISFGPWMLSVFRLLAKLKRLRGTALDPFGYTEERRMERRLIRDYEEAMMRVIASLSRDNHAAVVEVASLPAAIRGFGHVKRKSVEAALVRLPGLLRALDRARIPHAAE